MGRRIIPLLSAVIIFIIGCDDLTTQLEETIQESHGLRNTALILSFSSSPSGAGVITKPADPTLETVSGTFVDISAEPARGYDFLNWTYGVANKAKVTIEEAESAVTRVMVTGGNAEITANYVLEENDLTLASGTGGSAGAEPAELTDLHYGDEITLTAVPAEGFDFAEWEFTGTGSVEYTGGTGAQSNPASLYVYGGDVTARAVFTNTPRSLTLEVSPFGGGTVTDQADGTLVSPVTVGDDLPTGLKANPAEGYEFSHWTPIEGPGAAMDIDDPQAASTTVTLAGGDGRIRAEFALKEYNLTLTAQAGGTVSPSAATPCQHGVARSITATADSGYTFTRWVKTGGSDAYSLADETDPTTTVTLAGGDVTLQAQFTLMPRTIMVYANPGNGGTTAPSGAATVEDGTSFNLQAVPAAGYEFQSWSVPSGTNPDLIVTIDDEEAMTTTARVTGGNTVIYAYFTLHTYELTLTAGTGGSITSQTVRTVNHGAATTISAEPDSGYDFTGWTRAGGSTSYTLANESEPSTTVTLTGGDLTLQANFMRTPRSLTVTSDPASGGVTDPAGITQVEDGTEFNLTATPAAGYEFTGWTGTPGTGAALDITDDTAASTTATLIGGDASLTAGFAPLEYTLTLQADTGGSVDPAGDTTVQHGAAQSITATAEADYTFAGWTRAGGSTSYTLANENEPSTTVTLTGGDVTLQADFDLKPQVEAVVLTPTPNGVYTTAQTVTLTTSTAEAEIRYAAVTDGSDPGTDYASWTLYDGSGIELSAQDVTTTIHAVALRDGWRTSAASQGWYKITGTCATPVISPTSPTPAASYGVTLSTTTPGATIKYTLDGTTPSSVNGFTYSSGFTLDSNALLQAMAVKDDWTDSSVSSEEYETVWFRAHGLMTSAEVSTGLVEADGAFYTASNISNTTRQVMKINRDGTVDNDSASWKKQFTQSNYDIGSAITPSIDGSGVPDGGVVIAGKSVYDGVGRQYWSTIAKLNASGTTAWTVRHTPPKPFGDEDPLDHYSIKGLSNGSYVLSGKYHSQSGSFYAPLITLLNNNGTANAGYYWNLNTMTTIETPGLDVIPSTGTSTGYVIAGYGNNTSGSTEDGFIIISNLGGTIQDAWKVYGTGGGDDRIYAVKSTSDGGFVVAGTSDSTTIFNTFFCSFLLKLDSSGTIEEQQDLALNGKNTALYDVIETSDGGFIAVGEGEPVGGPGNKDVWVLKLNSDFTKAWEKAYGGAGEDSGRSIIETEDGGYLIAGLTSSLGMDQDTLVLKIDGSGNPTDSGTTPDFELGLTTSSASYDDMSITDWAASLPFSSNVTGITSESVATTVTTPGISSYTLYE